MNVPVHLPALGDNIESATVSQWLVGVGERVEVGQPLVEVSTDKVDTEIESTVAGVLTEIHVVEDDSVDVGAVIASIDHEEALDVDTSGPDPEPLGVPEPEPVPSPPASLGATSTSDLGPDDALRGTTQPLTRLRKTIAHRMMESLQSSAQLTTIVEVDVTEVGELRRRHNAALETGGTKLSFLPFIAAAALEALRAFPQVNSTVDLEAGTITYPAAEHLGVAVDTEKGLFVPVVRDAGELSVVALAERIGDVAERTRAGRITVDELSGGTFTITNTGSRGALMDTPIINQPQVAILGAGVVTRRPVARGRQGIDESLAIRSMVYLSLTYDHRVVDGADAARYLSAVKQRLEGASFELPEAVS